MDGNVLKEKREKLGLTIGELALKSKLPPSYLEAVEKGDKKLSSKAISKLAEVKGMAEEIEQIAMAITGFAEKLRALRDERGYSLKELGKLTGFSFTYLSELERGTINPSLHTIRVLADTFEIPVSLFIHNERKGRLVAEKLQRMRKLRGWSQKELARRAGVSPGLIGQIELGKVNASIATVEKLATALGVSVCFLILDQEDVDGIIGGVSPELRDMLYDPKVQTVIGSICTLDEERLKLVLNFVKMLSEKDY